MRDRVRAAERCFTIGDVQNCMTVSPHEMNKAERRGWDDLHVVVVSHARQQLPNRRLLQDNDVRLVHLVGTGA